MGGETMSNNILYRIFDAEQNLLYVGATTNPTLRFQYHAQNRPWWDEASEIKLHAQVGWCLVG